MIKACELRRNDIVGISGMPYVVEELKVTTPSARGASSLFRFRFRNILTHAKLDQTCKGDDKFDDVNFERRPAILLYKNHDGSHTFMDQEDYSQFSLNADELGEQAGFLTEETEDIKALVVNGTPAAVELPQCVVLKVIECDPTIKGQTATARTKSAHLETGIEIQVPEYVTTGEKVRVDTRNGEFLGRA